MLRVRLRCTSDASRFLVLLCNTQHVTALGAATPGGGNGAPPHMRMPGQEPRGPALSVGSVTSSQAAPGAQVPLTPRASTPHAAGAPLHPTFCFTCSSTYALTVATRSQHPPQSKLPQRKAALVPRTSSKSMSCHHRMLMESCGLS